MGERMAITYSENGFYIEESGDAWVIGLSEKGQDDLGTISFVELLKEDTLTADQSLISVEAAKAVTELVSPIDAVVLEWNEGLEDHPEWLNDEAYEKRWIVKVKKLEE